MRNREHLTPDIMTALKSGRLNREEATSALEHLGECEQCANAYAAMFRDTELLELPPGFQSAVFSAIEREKTSILTKKTAHRNRELFRYSFRVSIAACITLFLLFSGTMNYGISFSRSIHTDLSKFNVITEDIRGLSDKLVDFEVTKYLKEDK